METLRTMTAPIARSVTMPAWVESGLAQGAEAMKRLRDGLPPEVRRITDQVPGEVLVCACVLLVLFNVVVLLTNVKARPDATRDATRRRSVREDALNRRRVRSSPNAARSLVASLRSSRSVPFHERHEMKREMG